MEAVSSIDPNKKFGGIYYDSTLINPKLQGFPKFLQPLSYTVDSIRCYDPGTTVDLKFDGWIYIYVNNTKIKIPFKLA